MDYQNQTKSNHQPTSRMSQVTTNQPTVTTMDKPIANMPDIPTDEVIHLFSEKFSAMNKEIKELRETNAKQAETIVEMKNEHSKAITLLENGTNVCDSIREINASHEETIIKLGEKIAEQEKAIIDLENDRQKLRIMNATQKETLGYYEDIERDSSETISKLRKLIVELKTENSNLKNMEQDYVLLKEKHCTKVVEANVIPTTEVTIPTNEPTNGLEEFTKAREELVAYYKKYKDVYDSATKTNDKTAIALNFFLDQGNFDKYVDAIVDVHGSNPTELNKKYLSIAKKLRNAKISLFNIAIYYYELYGFMKHDEPLTF